MFNKETNITLIGMPGSGKTTIGKLLAKKLDFHFIDLDQYIEMISGMTVPQLFEISEAHFRECEREAVKKLKHVKSTVIATGGGTVKDPSNMDILKENGRVVFLDRPLEAIIKDIDMSGRPLLKNGGAERLRELYRERYELYIGCCDVSIINDKSEDAVVDSIIDTLSAVDLKIL